MLNREEIIIESLKVQLEFLDATSHRHLLWAEGTQDPVMRTRHIEMSGFLRHCSDQCAQLLEEYGKKERPRAS